jgi:hypothetical protein
MIERAQKWLTFAQSAGGLSLLLYVAGFLVVRARMNRLGVWTGTPLLNDAYLYEGGIFLLGTLEKVLFPWGLLLAATLAGTQLVSSLRGARARPSERWQPGRRTLAIGVAVFQLALVIGATLAFRATLLDALRTGAELLSGMPAQVPDAGAASLGYEYSVLLILTLAASVWFFSKERLQYLQDRWGSVMTLHPLIRTYLAGLLGFGLFVLPLRYAATVQQYEVPVAKLVPEVGAGGPEKRWFLLMHANQELVLFDGESITNVSRKNIKEIQVFCRHDAFTRKPECGQQAPSVDGGAAPVAADSR